MNRNIEEPGEEPHPPAAGAGEYATPSASQNRIDIAFGQTRKHLWWFREVGVDRFDVAIYRESTRTMIDVHKGVTGVEIERELLGFLRARNAEDWDIYVRPARGSSWSVILLDDVPEEVARRLKETYAAAVVETSPGRHHVWLKCDRGLTEEERRAAQTHLVQELRVGDPGSVSGEHFGRLAGFVNRKAQRRNADGSCPWINLRWYSRQKPAWPIEMREPQAVVGRATGRTAGEVSPKQATSVEGVDTTASGREWGYVCGRLEFLHKIGATRQKIDAEVQRLTMLLQRQASERGNHEPEDYARRTILKARSKVGI